MSQGIPDESHDPVRRRLSDLGFENVDALEAARRDRRSEWDGESDELLSFENSVDPRGTMRRLVILGAGASAEAGLPVSSELDGELRGLSQLKLYSHISNEVDSDVERVAQILGLIADTDDVLGSFLSRPGLWRDVVPKPPGMSRELAELELREMQDYIRRRFWLDNSKKCQYLAPLVQAQTGGTIATLNYDNSLTLVGDGIVTMQEALYDEPVSPVRPHPMRVRCLPLHGHLGWEERAQQALGVRSVVRRSEHQDPADLRYGYTPGIVFGAGNKLRHFGPYLALLHDFSEELRRTESLVAIGYSWRDEHVNLQVAEWASAYHRRHFSHLDTEAAPRRNMYVSTGPTTGVLPGFVEQLRATYGSAINVVPVRGPASEVISTLFSIGGVFAGNHYDSYREFWCSS